MDPPPEGVVDVPHAPEGLVPVAHLQVHLRARDMKLLTFFCKEFDVKFESAAAKGTPQNLANPRDTNRPRVTPQNLVIPKDRHFDD